MPFYTTLECEPFLSANDTIIERTTSYTDPDPSSSFSPHSTQRTSLHRITMTTIQLLLCSLLVANFVILALLFNSTMTTQKTTLQHPPGPTASNSAAALFNLKMKILQTQYGSDVSYMSLDPDFDWLWAVDGEEHAGLIMLDPPNGDGSIRWGAITMFHQLHCLSSLRTAIQRAARGENIGVDYRDDAHWPHCLYYLRQGILCHADDAIELPFGWGPGAIVNGSRSGGENWGETITIKRVGSIDGSRDLRLCRDTDELLRVVAERGYKGKDGK